MSHDLGFHDQVQGNLNGASIMSRISDASLLVGNLDKALEYSSEEVHAPVRPSCARERSSVLKHDSIIKRNYTV